MKAQLYNENCIVLIGTADSLVTMEAMLDIAERAQGYPRLEFRAIFGFVTEAFPYEEGLLE